MYLLYIFSYRRPARVLQLQLQLLQFKDIRRNAGELRTQLATCYLFIFDEFIDCDAAGVWSEDYV